jgi:hypothetical protein
MVAILQQQPVLISMTAPREDDAGRGHDDSERSSTPAQIAYPLRKAFCFSRPRTPMVNSQSGNCAFGSKVTTMADARVIQLWTVANRCRTDAIGVIWRELTDIRELTLSGDCMSRLSSLAANRMSDP